MKAIVFDRYGSSEVLELRDIEVPVVKDDEVLIRIRAAAANPSDWRVMRADPHLVRLSRACADHDAAPFCTDVISQQDSAVGGHAATLTSDTRSIATMRPSRMRMIRSQLAPTSASCVTSTTV